MPSKSANKNSNLWHGALLGALSALALVGLLAMGEALFDFPFVPFDIFDWMARVLPGFIIGTVINLMVAIISFLQGFLPIGDTSTAAKTAEQAIAITQVLVGGAVFGALLAWLGRDRSRNLVLFGQIGGLLLAGLTLMIESALGSAQLSGFGSLWILLLFLGWGWGLALLIRNIPASAPSSESNLSRRQFLTVSGAGLAAAAIGAWGIGKIFGEDALPAITEAPAQPVTSGDPFGASLTSGPAASPAPEVLAARTPAVSGTRPELTANEDFYRIDINTRAPDIDSGEWRLKITGLVDEPIELTLDELKAMPSQTQILTMQCISNPIGGDLTSSSRWTGVRFADVLALAGVQPSAVGAQITSRDGFYEFVVLEDIQDERCLLVYAMNDEPLPPDHGFPLRVYIPDRYGMKQPKWIEKIELMSQWQPGYWIDRGWDREAFVNTVSVVDTIMVDGDMALAGGIAWASAKGISKVEVQVNGGDWQEAELIAPPLSPLNWMLWRFSWPYEPGRQAVSVRAYDGSGQLQITESRPVAPSGATGIHSANVSI